MYKATQIKTTINTKCIMALPKPNSNSDMQTTHNPSGMRNIKATLNFQMNYGVLKTTTTPQISYGKYFENTKRITRTTKGVPCV